MKNHSSRLRAALQMQAAITLTVSSILASPAGPTPVIPEGGAAPGAFPNTSVTAVNVNARGSTTFNGSVDVTGFDGQGPIPWSANRFNRGDIALRLAPGNPTGALSILGQGFIEFGDGSPAIQASQAWRPSRALGVVMVSARQNGPIDWNDGEGGFYGTVALSFASSAPGYSMLDGSFANGDLDINTGRAGTHSSSPEANLDFGAAWFPYDQGWLGGDVAGPGPEGQSAWTNPLHHATGLSAGIVRWPMFPADSGIYGGLAEVRLPGVNTLEDGMLFAISSDGGSDVNIVGVDPLDDGSAWRVTIREDSETTADTLASASQSEFQFVYVPFNAQRLVGGHIVGSTGAKRKAAGDFTVTRTATGTYELTIPGKTGSNGMLMLQVADREQGTTEPLASRAFLSYQFANGKFTIQSRRTVSDTEAELADASFYVTWVDFSQPLALPDGPRMRSLGPVALNTEETVLRETAVAASTHEPEFLVVSIDTGNAGGYTDPLTGQPATAALVGQFHDARTLAPIGDKFVVLASSVAALTKADLVYNPVTRQYVAISSARSYNAEGKHVPMVSIVNPSANATRIAKVFVHDETTTESYDDVAISASSVNGNILLLAERAVTGEGESTVAALYSGNGTLLTPPATRVDPLQTVGDEDDPDAVYLPGRDKFFYVSNTDNSNGSTGTLSNRIVGSLIDPVPGPGGTLVVRTEQPLGDGLPAGPEGHPASIENPFNGQLITVYDAGNNTSAGDISYYNLGTAPNFVFTPAMDEVPYLRGVPGNPFRHQHPQLEVDPVSGTFLLAMNAVGSDIGLPNAMAFWILGPDGKPLPGQLPAPWLLADAPGGVSNSVNFFGVTYSPAAQSFIVAYSAGPGIAYVTSLQVTSSHLAPAEAPTITVARTGNSVTLQWPASATGYVLESATAPAGTWTAAGLSVSVVDGLSTATTTAADDVRLYRLRKP
jgi:hypothetical protein